MANSQGNAKLINVKTGVNDKEPELISRSELVFRYLRADPKLKPAEIHKRILTEYGTDINPKTISSASNRWRHMTATNQSTKAKHKKVKRPKAKQVHREDDPAGGMLFETKEPTTKHLFADVLDGHLANIVRRTLLEVVSQFADSLLQKGK